jgi:hypothetical protein
MIKKLTKENGKLRDRLKEISLELDGALDKASKHIFNKKNS